MAKRKPLIREAYDTNTGELLPRPHGFVLRKSPRPDKQSSYYVRRGYRLEPCTGEAHENGHIDHCMRCAPAWGVIAVVDETVEVSLVKLRELSLALTEIASACVLVLPDPQNEQIAGALENMQSGVAELINNGVRP
jgi:hypothetical protein